MNISESVLHWNQSQDATTKPGEHIAVSSEDIGENLLLVLVIFNCCSSLVGTVGNALTMAAILLNDSLHTIPDMFILSLSLSDLIVVAIYQPLNAVRLSNLQFAASSTTFTQTRRFIGFTALNASGTSLFCVTLERLIAIRFPLKCDLYATPKRAKHAIVCLWVFALLLAAIYTLGNNVTFVVVQVYFLLLLLATVLMYMYILVVARRHEKAMVIPEGHQPSTAQNRKAARTIAIVLGVFLSCWLPFLVIPPIVAKYSQPVMHERLVMVFLTLSTCHSSINPFIYCFRSSRYRKAIAKLVGSTAQPNNNGSTRAA